MVDVVYNFHLNTLVINKKWKTIFFISIFCRIFDKIGVNVDERGIQICHRRREKYRTIV